MLYAHRIRSDECIAYNRKWFWVPWYYFVAYNTDSINIKLGFLFKNCNLVETGMNRVFAPEWWKSLNQVILWGLPADEPLRGTAGQCGIYQYAYRHWSAAGAPRRGQRGSSQKIERDNHSITHLCLIQFSWEILSWTPYTLSLSSYTPVVYLPSKTPGKWESVFWGRISLNWTPFSRHTYRTNPEFPEFCPFSVPMENTSKSRSVGKIRQICISPKSHQWPLNRGEFCHLIYPIQARKGCQNANMKVVFSVKVWKNKNSPD